MSDQDTDSTFFGRADRQGVDSSSMTALPGQTAIGKVRSLLFDDLRVQAGSGAALEGWRVEVISLALPKPSRRRLRLMLRGQINIARQGQARISVSCESRRASAEATCLEDRPLPNGALPSRNRSVDLSLTLPRSVRPRKLIRIQVLLEATAESEAAQAEAVVDSIDLEAL